MVGLLAVVATVVASVFAQATSVRWHQRRTTHEGVWTFALALFALASVCLFLGSTTGWDPGVYKAFYLLGGALNVPWLALGTVYLLGSRRLADRVRAGLIFFSGLATGAVLVSPLRGTLPTDAIPHGPDHFGALPRICVAAGSGLGAIVLFGGAAVSAWRWRRPTSASRWARSCSRAGASRRARSGSTPTRASRSAPRSGSR